VLGLSRFPYFCLVLLCFLVGWVAFRHGASVQAEDKAAPHQDPNGTCAPCHREIYQRYLQTPMANASGRAADGLIPADFRHEASGVHFHVLEHDSRVWLTYERDDPNRALEGRQELQYFIGSGKRGRTYLFEQEGYWFESPINWYSKNQIWDMAPNHLTDREMSLTLPVDSGCLHCHASGVASALPDARNHYAAAPFSQGGITCVECHGDGAAHLSSKGKVHMTDIDSLEPVRRDSVCLTCHLEGQAAVSREGRKMENFAPGDNLFDYQVFFVYKSEKGSGGRATSQWEALLKSQCKQKSGDRMTCTTCHDPHGSPPPDQRVSFYRKRCLQCHNQTGFGEKHHPENPDCTICHMARPPSNDIAHEQVTDHWIKKRVNRERLPLSTTGELKVVGGVAADDREFGLAFADLAARGDQHAAPRALELLRRAEKSSSDAPHDYDLHAQLGFLEQVNGQTVDAAAEYRRALSSDPYGSLAEGNLAWAEAQQHHYAEAARLWALVFEHDPLQLGAGLNLAVMQCRLGQRQATINTIGRLLTFAPDDDKARAMLAQLRKSGRQCESR
jgi:predicted CXXCH cytochrome family protein